MIAWLFCPGHDERKLKKALASSADVVIADWEDAVPLERKSDARAVTKSVLSEASYDKRVFIRVNSSRSESYNTDIEALRQLEISGVMLPKSESSSELQSLAQVGFSLVPLIETALGVECAFEIAKAHPLVERLAFGSLDYCADVGGDWTPEGEAYRYARARVVVAGRAAGREGSLDGVFPRLGDISGLEQDAAFAKRLGYAGKLIIHPEQIEPVTTAFAPRQEDVERARQIIEATHEARQKGEAAIRLNGEFVDPPVVRWAENTLKAAKRETR